jgi:iduronate 2-sulfatase
LGLRDNTLVLFCGDHGFFLGENGMWAKNTLFDQATQVPMIMYVPWLANLDFAGGKSAAITTRFAGHFELLDLYRTMASMFNLTIDPTINGLDQSDAIYRSFMMADGDNSTAQPQFTNMSFSEVVRCAPNVVCDWVSNSGIRYIGYTVRTFDWRYTVWLNYANGNAVWTSARLGEELYDHSQDGSWPSFAVEAYNLAAVFPDVCNDMYTLIANRFAPVITNKRRAFSIDL